MSLAVSVKVNDGIVLAADSASTILVAPPPGAAPGFMAVMNVYNNAQKVFNLIKPKPIGVMTWGTGSLGSASIATAIKNFRDIIKDTKDKEYYTDPENYTVIDVATKLTKYIKSLYDPAFASWPQKPLLGFIVAGFSGKDRTYAEEYQIDFINNGVVGPNALKAPEQCGISFSGDGEALHRLIIGYSSMLPAHLANVRSMTDPVKVALGQVAQSLVADPMPIQDAIDLADFLVEVGVNFSRFTPGPPTIGGPIDIAAITRHEDFKWIRRKHYYSDEYNQQYTKEVQKV